MLLFGYFFSVILLMDLSMLGISPNFDIINKVWVNESEIYMSHSVILKKNNLILSRIPIDCEILLFM